MAITCVWCWTLLDHTNISGYPRLENHSLNTSCKGQSHACWRSLGSCTIAVLFTVIRIFLHPPFTPLNAKIYTHFAHILQQVISFLRSIQLEIRLKIHVPHGFPVAPPLVSCDRTSVRVHEAVAATYFYCFPGQGLTRRQIGIG